jgi:hypothetical protein
MLCDANSNMADTKHSLWHDCQAINVIRHIPYLLTGCRCLIPSIQSRSVCFTTSRSSISTL